MSFTPTSELLADPITLLRCRQHAARIFADDQFRLLPKTKFLFHVSFDIDWDVANPKPKGKSSVPLDKVNPSIVETLKDEINLLVKDISLPSYSIQHEVLNQYNRKKVVQFQHKYNDVDVTFHDDNMGLINQVWQLYYKYYYADPTVAFQRKAYIKNAMLSSDHITVPYGYNGRKKPFFKSIMIYQMSRKEFVSYKLINPIITAWTGGKLGYHEQGAHHFEMKLAYEAVWFNTGFVNQTSGQVDMSNFGLLSPLYDTTASPLYNTDPTRGPNDMIGNSKSFATVPFGSTDSSNPTLIVSTLSDNVVVDPSLTQDNSLIYSAVLSKPPVSGLQDVAMPAGKTNSNTTASQASVPNTSVDTTTQANTAEHTQVY